MYRTFTKRKSRVHRRSSDIEGGGGSGNRSLSSTMAVAPEVAEVQLVEAADVQPPASTESVKLGIKQKKPALFETASTRECHSKLHTLMYKAAMRGDWEAAESLLQKDPSLARAEITERGDGALHVAAASKRTKFVLQLVKLMSPSDLLLPNKFGHTAFCYAAESGIVKIAAVMRKKNRSLVTMRGRNAMTPLHIAAFFGNKDMVSYLRRFTREEDMSTEEWFDLLIATTRGSMFDVALEILDMNGALAKMRNEEGTALHHLVEPVIADTRSDKQTLSNFLFPELSRRLARKSMERGAQLLAEKLWAEMQTMDQTNVADLINNPLSILDEAAKVGNVELIVMIARSDPDLLLKVDGNNHTIFHTSIVYRQEKVFSLIHQIGYLKEMVAISVDNDGNSILHLAGKLAPPSRLTVVSGAAFQMEREMLWFTEVAKVVPLTCLKMKNKDGWEPREVFSMEHRSLLEDGEDWMKETSNSWMLIATLIATVAFSAAITLPGGINSDTGLPILLKSRWFTVFLVSDVIAMLCATSSLLTFSFIITSRYHDGNFIFRLPTSFKLAMFTLAYAVVAMLVAFTSAFYLVFHEQQTWIPKCIIFFTCLTLVYARRPISMFTYSRRGNMFSRLPSKLLYALD